MNYFRLIDDIHFPDRWHIGDIVSVPMGTVDLLRNQRLASEVVLQTTVSHAGIPLDFCVTSFGIPIAKRKLANAITLVVKVDVQIVPIRIDNLQNGNGYVVLNCLRAVDCMDEQRSEFIKWTSADHRTDLAGQYRMVTSLHLDSSKIPKGAHMFRLLGWPVALIVSQVVKDAMEIVGCCGAKFEAID